MLMAKPTIDPRATQTSGPWYDARSESAGPEGGQVMAVGLLATITIQEGKNEEFEEASTRLTLTKDIVPVMRPLEQGLS